MVRVSCQLRCRAPSQETPFVDCLSECRQDIFRDSFQWGRPLFCPFSLFCIGIMAEVMSKPRSPPSFLVRDPSSPGAGTVASSCFQAESLPRTGLPQRSRCLQRDQLQSSSRWQHPRVRQGHCEGLIDLMRASEPVAASASRLNLNSFNLAFLLSSSQALCPSALLGNFLHTHLQFRVWTLENTTRESQDREWTKNVS